MSTISAVDVTMGGAPVGQTVAVLVATAAAADSVVVAKGEAVSFSGRVKLLLINFFRTTSVHGFVNTVQAGVHFIERWAGGLPIPLFPASHSFPFSPAGLCGSCASDSRSWARSPSTSESGSDTTHRLR